MNNQKTDKTIYLIGSYGHDETAITISEELEDYLSPARVPFRESINLDLLTDSDVVLCIITPSFFGSTEVKEELQYAFNLNKPVVGITNDSYGLFFRLKVWMFSMKKRMLMFRWYSDSSKSSCVGQLMAWLGLSKPLMNAIGRKVIVRVKASRGFQLQIDTKKFVYNGSRAITIRLLEGVHNIHCTDNRNPLCTMKKTLGIKSHSEVPYHSYPEDIVFDMDTAIEDYGYEDVRDEADGSHYEGTIKHNRYNGKGSLRLLNGDVYSGNFVNGEITEGMATYNDGSTYKGAFKDMNRNGNGEYRFTNGDKYVGNWVDGKMHGTGRLTFAGGGYYNGGFHKDVFRGNGFLKFADGESYKGEFLNGKFHGQGVYKYADGSIKHEGQWVEGNFKPSTLWGKINKWFNG